MKTPAKLSAAFSLIELLVVIGIIAIMATAGVVALGGGSKSVQSAATAASSVFSMARTEAILRRVPVRVIVDTSYNAAKPDDYLRRIAVVAKKEDTTDWEPISQWMRLPANAFFNPDVSKRYGSGSMTGVGGNGTSFAYFEFLPNGQASSPRAQFIVTRGALAGDQFSELGTANRSGFVVHKLGRMTFFNDPADIPQS